MKHFKKVFYTYPAWLLLAQISAFIYGRGLSDFNVRAFISVNGIELVFALYMFYYLFNTEENWVFWIKKVLAGFGYAFLIIIFFQLLFSVF